MLLGAIIPLAVLGLIVLGLTALFRRGGDGPDFGPRNLLRLYLYVASLAGIIVLVVGLSGLLNAGFATVFGNGFAYGETVAPPAVAPACPPNVPSGSPQCKPGTQVTFNAQDNDRKRADDLIRGITFTVFGLAFWGAHWAARRGIVGVDEPQSGLRRGYLMLGTVVFGLATITLLPMGIYQALSYFILPPTDSYYRPGAGEALAAGIATLPVWLSYLWLVVREFRAVRAVPAPVA
jgi:hypothetical protein